MTTPEDTAARLFTREEVKAHFRISNSTIHRWHQAGLFPGAFRLPGGPWRYPAEDVRRIEQGGWERPASPQLERARARAQELRRQQQEEGDEGDR